MKTIKQRGGFRPCLAWLVVAAAMSAPWTAASAEQDVRVKVLLRYDDYTRDSSRVVESRLFAGLQEIDAPLLVGVVPFIGMPYPESTAMQPLPQTNLGEEKIAFLRSSLVGRRIEVALHGFNHQQNFLIDNKPSEFAGHGLDRQRQLLGLGRAALESALGQNITVFVPSFNTVDENSFKALSQEGFSVLSSGMDPPGGETSLALVPGTVYPQQVRRAIEDALRSQGRNTLIVVVMHPYDFEESGEQPPAFRKNPSQMTLEALMNDLRWARSQQGVDFVSVSELLATDEVSAQRVLANVRLHGGWTVDLLPSVLLPDAPKGFLLAEADARNAYLILLLRALLLYVSLGYCGYRSSCFLSRLSLFAHAREWQRRVVLVGVVSVGVLGLATGFYFAKMATLVFGLGWYVGVPRAPSLQAARAAA